MPGILDTLGAQYNLSPEFLNRVVQIESGGNPRARTGSYHGLFQLSAPEFNKQGGGNIYSAEDNARAGVANLAQLRDNFVQKYGRDPSNTELYMLHQQGPAGFDQHYTNPDQPAWRSMLSTGEGQQKGEAWAKQAIWGNIPDSMKAQYGNVNNVTSGSFLNDVWRPKFEGGSPAVTASGSPAGLPVQAEDIAASGSPPGLPIPPAQPNPSVDALMAQRQRQQSANLGLSLGNQFLNPQAQFSPMMQFAPLRIPQAQVPYGIGRA